MALPHLNDPMDCNQPVKFMLRAIEEVQMFLLAHSEADKELANTNLILYTLININKTGGMYTKALKRWNTKELTDRKIWDTFHQHMIVEFEKLIASGARPTIVQEGYGGAYNMTEVADDGKSIAKSIVHYADRVAAAKSKVSNPEIRLSQLET